VDVRIAGIRRLRAVPLLRHAPALLGRQQRQPVHRPGLVRRRPRDHPAQVPRVALHRRSLEQRRREHHLARDFAPSSRSSSDRSSPAVERDSRSASSGTSPTRSPPGTAAWPKRRRRPAARVPPPAPGEGHRSAAHPAPAPRPAPAAPRPWASPTAPPAPEAGSRSSRPALPPPGTPGAACRCRSPGPSAPTAGSAPRPTPRAAPWKRAHGGGLRAPLGPQQAPPRPAPVGRGPGVVQPRGVRAIRRQLQRLRCVRQRLPPILRLLPPTRSPSPTVMWRMSGRQARP
jgi:hypothetical protein